MKWFSLVCLPYVLKPALTLGNGHMSHVIRHVISDGCLRLEVRKVFSLLKMEGI